MKERNLAVKLLERLLQDDIKNRFKTHVVKAGKYSELLQESLKRYRNRTIGTAQVIEELIALWKQFPEEASRALTSWPSTTRWPPISRRTGTGRRDPGKDGRRVDAETAELRNGRLVGAGFV